MNDQLDFENELRRIAAAMDYPPTPTVQISRRRVPLRPNTPRFAWMAVILLALIVVSIAAPPIRAALLEIIGIGAVEITVTDSTPSPLNAAPVQLTGETTLDAAQESISFRLKYPRSWPSPDNVYQPDTLSRAPGNAVFNVMVWRDTSGAVDRALYQSPVTEWAVFKQVDALSMIEVNGETAIWLDAPHLLSFEGRTGSPVTASNLVEGNVLIWLADNITYRLEGMPDVRSAVEAAESLADWERKDD